MPYAFVQHGTAASIVNTSGTITAITLPTNVTISSSRIPRFAVWGQEVIMVNAPSKPIAVNRDGAARVVTPRPPSDSPYITGTGSGSLTGSYRVKVSFIVRDSFGNLISESGLSPVSNTASLSAQSAIVTGIPISTETISARRLYRTTNGGSVYFPWIDVDGNTVTSVTNDLADAGLQLIAAPDALGSIPDLYLIAEWRGRLWGVERNKVDFLRRSDADQSYGWDPDNAFLIPQRGGDSRGIVALIRRRDELGVARQSAFHMITGNSNQDFTRVGVHEAIGCLSQESVQVIDNVGYFIGFPHGVYRWDDSGVQPISNEKVRGWFQTDTYFNRARFQYAKSAYDPEKHLYQLHLAAAGSSDEDRWVHYDIEANQWYGPHKTGEFTPTAAGLLQDASELPAVTIGSSNGFLWKNQATRTDGTSTAIDFDVDTPFLSGESGPVPDITKLFLQPAIISGIEASGSLTITPKVGGLDASAGTAFTHTLTTGRERLPRLGVGRFAQLNMRQNTAGVNVKIYGLEIPYHELGRR